MTNMPVYFVLHPCSDMSYYDLPESEQRQVKADYDAASRYYRELARLRRPLPSRSRRQDIVDQGEMNQA